MLMASVWLLLYRLLAPRLLSDLLPAQTALIVPGLPASGRGGPSFAVFACSTHAEAAVIKLSIHNPACNILASAAMENPVLFLSVRMSVKAAL